MAEARGLDCSAALSTTAVGGASAGPLLSMSIGMTSSKLLPQHVLAARTCRTLKHATCYAPCHMNYVP